MNHLKNHRESHTIEKPYSCNHCTSSFKSFAEAVLHWKEHPRIFKVLAVFVCEICDRDVKELSLLYKHKQKRHQPMPRKSENGEKKFICELCGNIFAIIEEFQEHGKYRCSKFPCDICGSLLPTANSLNAHKRRHSGLRPYVSCLYRLKIFLLVFLFIQICLQYLWQELHSIQSYVDSQKIPYGCETVCLRVL